MKKFICAVVSFLLIISCATQDSEFQLQDNPSSVVFDGNPEAVSGKVDVYSSMARTAKYNADVSFANILKTGKALQEEKETEKILSGLLQSRKKSENELLEALTELDAAISYGLLKLISADEVRENVIYDKVAHNLALAAVFTHKNMMFAKAEQNKVEKFLTAEKKKLAVLQAKLDKNGRLAPNDAATQANLQNMVNELENMQQMLNNFQRDYLFMVKADKSKIALEGKPFYEVQGFNFAADTLAWKYAAFKNRLEPLAANENVRINFNELENESKKIYPKFEESELANLKVTDANFRANLAAKANKAVKMLLASLRSKDKNEKWKNLAVATFVQIDVIYNVAKYNNENLQNIVYERKDLRKQLRDAKEADESKKLALLKLEYDENLSMAYRTMAIKYLAFLASSADLGKDKLEKQLKDIEKSIKTLLNQDMSEFAKAAKMPMELIKEKDWAKGQNWLENLMNNPQKSKRKEIGSFEAYPQSFNAMKIMQLGAFSKPEYAVQNWELLSRKYAELRAYNFELEEKQIKGQIFYRLTVKAETGGFVSLCNKLRANFEDCILR